MTTAEPIKKKNAPLLLTQPASSVPSSEYLTETTIIPALVADVFVEQSSTRNAFEQASRDRRTSKMRWNFINGNVSSAISRYKENSSPHLIFLESLEEPDTLLKNLEQLAQHCDPKTKVIIISEKNDVDFYRRLIENGITDELVFPFRSNAVIDAIARAWKDVADTKIGLMTAFIGSRGGTGSSTVAHNVAVAMSKKLETNVLLADLDLQFGTVGIDFDVDGSYGMNEVLRSADRLDDVLLNRLALKYDENLFILASETSLDRTADIHRGAIERLTEVTHTSPRHVILDIPRIWTRRTKQALISADHIVITATPDLTSLRNAKIIVEFLRQVRPNDPMPLLVLNQIGQPKRPEISPEQFAEAVRLDLGPSLNYDAALFGRAANNGQLVADVAAKSPYAKKFLEIAKILNGYKIAPSKGTVLRRTLRAARNWW